jgi:hypothetical protein
MPTVIDSLIVTLGLDPSKYGSGVKKADKKLAAFEATCKRLGIEEKNLDDKQKVALKSLRDLATQSTRTGKELAATSGVGAELWSVMEKGALAFGAALGLDAIKDFTVASVQANAAMTRIGPNMGLAAKEADAWGKAVANSVGGNAQAALGTLQQLSNALSSTAFGQPPSALLAMAAQAARYNNGKPIAVLGAGGKARSQEDFLLDLADPLKNMGPQKAQAFGAMYGLDPDTVNFLDRGRKAAEGDLTTARKATLEQKGFEEDERLRKATAELSTEFNHLKDVLVVLTAPALTLGLKNLSALLQFAQDHDWAKYQAAVRANDAAARSTPDDPGGKKWLAAQDADSVLPLVQNHFGDEVAYTGTGRYAFPKRTGGIGWTDDQKRARLQQLILDGETPQSAAEIVSQEMAAGRAPGAATGTMPIGGGGGSSGPRGTRDNNPGNLMFAGQEGATGDTYTDKWGATRTLARFPTQAAGMAALKAQLGRYFAAGTNTIAGIYSKYAPASDHNPTDAGIRHISEWTGFAPGAALQNNQATIDALAAAIARQETGSTGGSSGDTTIHQNGPVTINVPSGDPHAIGGGWHKAVVDQAQTGPS